MVLMILVMVGILVLFVVGMLTLAMHVLHRKPHDASAQVTHERHRK